AMRIAHPQFGSGGAPGGSLVAALPRHHRDDPPMSVRAQRQEDCECCVSGPRCQGILRQPRTAVPIGDVEGRTIGDAFERSPDLLTNGRTGTISTDAPSRSNAEEPVRTVCQCLETAVA